MSWKMKQKKIIFILLLLIVIVGTIIRFHHLSGESLWTDEMVTISHLRGNFNHLIGSITDKELMPAGYFLLMKPVIAAFGESEFSLRFLSVLFDILSIILVYLVGSKWFDKKVGILSSIFLATAMLQVVYAQEARPYSLFGFLVLLATYLFIQAKKNKIIWLLYILIITASLYTNYMALFVILIHFLITAFYFKENIKRNLLSILAAMVMFTPGIPILYQQVLLRQASLTKNLVLRGVPEFLGQLGIVFYLLPLTLLTIFLVLFFVMLKRLEKIRREQLIGLTGIMIIMAFTAQIIFLDTTLRSFALIRHSFFIVPFIYILAAKGITLIKHKKLTGILLVIILLFNFITLTIYYTETTKTPWNQAAKFIEEESIGKPVVLLDRSGSNTQLYNYYQKKDVKIIELTEDVEGEIFELGLVQINKELGSVKEFWFISSRNFKGKVDYEFLLDKNFYKIKTIYFKEMVVIKFDNITKDLITIH